MAKTPSSRSAPAPAPAPEALLTQEPQNVQLDINGLPLPTTGGCYVRLPDNSLIPDPSVPQALEE